MNKTDTNTLLRRLERLEAKRQPWESLWDSCFSYALPQREPRSGLAATQSGGRPRGEYLFDGTAPDAVDQLAASLLAQLAPPWSRWFGLAAGREIPDAEQDTAARELDRIAEIVQGHFDRSNLAIELHQCFLDLVTGGTASLLFEEAPVGKPSAFRFTAVPLDEMYLEEGPDGRLDVSFRRLSLPADQFRDRFPKALPDAEAQQRSDGQADPRIHVIEAVVPEARGYRYAALRPGDAEGEAQLLSEGRFEVSPFVNFRWMKAPGEHWGRSPVMKALPDIRTANKVVELVLKTKEHEANVAALNRPAD